jgi:hypothetical protein
VYFCSLLNPQWDNGVIARSFVVMVDDLDDGAAIEWLMINIDPREHRVCNSFFFLFHVDFLEVATALVSMNLIGFSKEPTSNEMMLIDQCRWLWELQASARGGSWYIHGSESNILASRFFFLSKNCDPNLLFPPPPFFLFDVCLCSYGKCIRE